MQEISPSSKVSVGDLYESRRIAGVRSMRLITNTSLAQYFNTKSKEWVYVYADVFYLAEDQRRTESSVTENCLTAVELNNDRKITDPQERAYWLLRFENGK